MYQKKKIGENKSKYREKGNNKKNVEEQKRKAKQCVNKKVQLKN